MGEKIAFAAGYIAVILLLLFGGAWIEMLLWNGCLVPAVSGLNEVGYWQMMGITILLAMLVKSGTVQRSKD